MEKYVKESFSKTVTRAVCDRCGCRGPAGADRLEACDKALANGWEEWDEIFACHDCAHHHSKADE